MNSTAKPSSFSTRVAERIRAVLPAAEISVRDPWWVVVDFPRADDPQQAGRLHIEFLRWCSVRGGFMFGHHPHGDPCECNWDDVDALARQALGGEADDAIRAIIREETEAKL